LPLFDTLLIRHYAIIALLLLLLIIDYLFAITPLADIFANSHYDIAIIAIAISLAD